MRSSSSASTSSITSFTRAVRGYRFAEVTCSRPLALEPGGLDVEQLDVGRRDHEPLDRGEHLTELRIAARDDGRRDRGTLPLVLVVDLGHRDPEPVAQPVDDRADGGALRLQRSTLWHMQIETNGGGVHNAILAPPAVAPRYVCAVPSPEDAEHQRRRRHRR